MNDYDGILPTIEAFYIHSIIYSASRCLDAFARYETLEKTQYNAVKLVSIVQEAVGHSAALSRYFWPSKRVRKKQPMLNKLGEKRGEKLRRAFGVDENSIFYNRDLRNAWEHFDERLDEYFLENDVGVFFPSSLLGKHSLADDPLGHIFKLLDVQENCLVLMGVKYYFAPIRNEVYRILEIASDFNAHGARLSG